MTLSINGTMADLSAARTMRPPVLHRVGRRPEVAQMMLWLAFLTPTTVTSPKEWTTDVRQVDIPTNSGSFRPYLLTPSSASSSPTTLVDDPNASIKYIYEESGLTWDQLSKVFGVSRRAVHHWAAGGRMNAHNAEVASRLKRIVQQLPTGDRDSRRHALLQLGNDGRSILDHLQAEAIGAGRISGPQLEPADLLGGPADEA